MNRTIMLKILQASLFMTFSVSSHAGESCGSKEGYLNQLTSKFIIPDYFPPENDLFKSLVSEVDYDRCQDIKVISLSVGCQLHDSCYEKKLDKTSCDRSLQDSWVKACRDGYYKLTFDSQTCRLACESFMKLMSEAQRYNSNGICPSCDAYDTQTE